MHLSLPWRAVFYFLAFTLFTATSCNKFDGEQTVPSYLRVDSVSFSSNQHTQGTNSHKITDIWVYVNSQLIGAYELPVTFPVLARGKQKLEIRPGIKMNGIAATRVPYPFYKPYIINGFNFIEDSVQLVQPVSSYYDNLTFAWMEDFENTSLSIEKTSRSDTGIFRTSPAYSPQAFTFGQSAYSGVIHLEGLKQKFQVASFSGYSLPGKGSPVFVELNYKCDRPFGIGMFATLNGSIINMPLLVANKSEQWNKLYINLSPNVTEYSTATNFKIYFESDKGVDNQAQFFFDNIKLIFRNNP